MPLVARVRATITRTRPLLATVALLSFAPVPAHAWDSIGHMAVALIAWRHMTPEARAAAVRLLESAPADAGLASLRPSAGTAAGRDQALFALAATWPDIVRASTPAARHAYHHGSWHYTDQYWREVNGVPEPAAGPPADPQNVGERIQVFQHDLAIGNGTRSERGVELAWVMHLVGDIAQPLHNSSRITAAFPNGDAGGNRFRLGPNSESLHWYWDSILDRVIPREPGESAMAHAERVADRVEHDRAEPSLAARIEPGRVDLWEREGLALSEHVVYAPSLVPNQDPGATYQQTAFDTAETQVALAGYRLAEMLNRTLGGVR